MNTKPASLIAGCGHHTTLCIVSHCYRFAFQFWMVALLYGCEELIHIYMNDFHLSVICPLEGPCAFFCGKGNHL